MKKAGLSGGRVNKLHRTRRAGHYNVGKQKSRRDAGATKEKAPAKGRGVVFYKQSLPDP